MRVTALGGKADAAAGRGVMQRAADTRGLVLRHARSAGGAQGEEAGSARKLEERGKGRPPFVGACWKGSVLAALLAASARSPFPASRTGASQQREAHAARLLRLPRGLCAAPPLRERDTDDVRRMMTPFARERL
jgi:hypothetical protein